MASFPSQSPNSQRQSLQQRHSPPPSPTALSQQNRQASPSQSATSEDSQTVFLNTPSSGEVTPEARDRQQRPKPPKRTTTAPEPRKCWICFSDETEDSPSSSEWRSPCPCALTAHESCLLDWVADLEAPKDKGAGQQKRIQCPQCKADIKISRPRSLVVDYYRAVEAAAGRLLWPTVIVSALSGLGAACVVHGASTVLILFGSKDANRFMGLGKNGKLTGNHVLTLGCVPALLVLSRTKVADSVLPLLPILYITGRMPVRESRNLWPPSAAMTLASLPYIRGMYNIFLRKAFAEKEKAWMRQIQPRQEEHQENQNGPAQEEEPAAEEGGGLNFELGVELEIIEDVEEVEDRPDDNQRQQDQAENPQPENAPPNQNDNHNPPQQQLNEGQNQNHEQGQNQPPAGPENNQNGFPIPPEAHRHIRVIPLFNQLLGTIVGALAFPTIAAGVGGLLSVALPRTWTTPPGFWDHRRAGFFQSRFGRSVAGGCLFVVLKDTLNLYSKYRIAKDHQRRRVVDYEGRRGTGR